MEASGVMSPEEVQQARQQLLTGSPEKKFEMINEPNYDDNSMEDEFRSEALHTTNNDSESF